MIDWTARREKTASLIPQQMIPCGASGVRVFHPLFESPVKRYLKLGLGGAHTESNQRLMYTSA